MLTLRIVTPMNVHATAFVKDALERELGPLASDRDEGEGRLSYRLGLIGPNIRYSRFVAFDSVVLEQDSGRNLLTLALGVRRIFVMAAGFAGLTLGMAVYAGPLRPLDLLVALGGPALVALWCIGSGYLAVRRWWLNIAL